MLDFWFYCCKQHQERHNEKTCLPDLVELSKGNAPGPIGAIYLMQLRQGENPNELKLGWTQNLTMRIPKFRTSAPNTICIGLWPAIERSWENEARSFIKNNIECNFVSVEVFLVRRFEEAIAKIDSFLREKERSFWKRRNALKHPLSAIRKPLRELSGNGQKPTKVPVQSSLFDAVANPLPGGE